MDLFHFQLFNFFSTSKEMQLIEDFIVVPFDFIKSHGIFFSPIHK